MSDIFYIDSASFQTFEVTNVATINNATVNGTLSVSRAIDGTSSYALSSVSSSYASAIKTNTDATYYPIFIDSNNSSTSYEQLYTDANAFLTYNPTTGSLTAKIFTNTISGQINNITSSYAVTASYAMNGGGTIINTGSFLTTGSSGTSQLISGSLTINQNLIVLGSASITNISQSTLNIGTNLITVNTNTPTTRFGGLAVIDSGSSPQRSGSLLFDSTNDQWIFIHQSSTTPTSSVLIMGPETYNNIGNETNLTTNKIPKSVNAEHIGDSNITDDGTKVSISSSVDITGSLRFLNGGVTGSLFGTSSWASNASTASYVVTAQTASYVTGSIYNSTNPALSASYAATASRVISSNGSAFNIQYGGGASGILMTGSSNLQYNGSNMTLTNGYILQSNGTNYYLYLGKTGLVGANETGIWSYDSALDNTYPITSYDISTNKYYFANYQIIYDGASGRLGVGVSPTTAKLQVNGNVVATSFTGSISASNIDGTLPITKGGTGATTSTTAKSNIGFYDAYLINAQTTAAGADTTINNISLITQANEVWSFEAYLTGQVSGVGGARFTVAYSSASVSSSITYQYNSTALTNWVTFITSGSTPVQSSTGWTAATTDFSTKIVGSFINSGSANTVTLKVQPVNGAQTVTMKSMCYLTARRIS